jgi:DNA excision repair protein ERCC-4
VDLREFRSTLPSLLHARKIILHPCTIEVGDYVLTPKICVERKSISDLVQSLKSGRLYTQAEAMCIHYDIPCLLIEFAQGKAFNLSIPSDDSGVDTASRLLLLCIHFAKLRIIWSPSPTYTAEMFEQLKVRFILFLPSSLQPLFLIIII